MENFVLIDPKTNLSVDVKDKKVTPELIAALRTKYRVEDTSIVGSYNNTNIDEEIVELSEEEIF